MNVDVCCARHGAWLALPLAERKALNEAATRARRRRPIAELVACEHGCGAREDEPCRDTDCGERCHCPRCDVDDRRDRRDEIAGYRRHHG